MLGVDPYWERIHLAYHFEVDRRTRYKTSGPTFELGEIAYVEDEGTLSSSLYDFLEWQGLELTQQERVWRDKLKLNGFGRMCLVVQRLDDGTYIICFLASFGETIHGKNIKGSLAKLFAIAIDDTPEFPLGTPSIKVVPKWKGHGFLYAIPVPRRNLRRHKINIRFILRMGELERVKRLILERVKIFKANHIEFRQEDIRWKNLRVESDPVIGAVGAPDIQMIHGLDAVQEPPTALTSNTDITPSNAHSGMTSSVNHTTRSTSEPYTPSQYTHVVERERITGPRKIPRIHYLETNSHWLNVKWPLDTMNLDIMHSSTFLNGIDIGRRPHRAWTSTMSWRRLPLLLRKR